MIFQDHIKTLSNIKEISTLKIWILDIAKLKSSIQVSRLIAFYLLKTKRKYKYSKLIIKSVWQWKISKICSKNVKHRINLI